MTTREPATTAAALPAPTRNALRLRLKPNEPTPGGRADGTWWPHSRNLFVELPPLLSALAVRLGGIERVMYNLACWQPAADRLTDEDAHVVLLAGFHSQHPDTVTVMGQDRRCLTLLVAPPETAPAAVGAAARTDSANRRWESDGGSIR